MSARANTAVIYIKCMVCEFVYGLNKLKHVYNGRFAVAADAHFCKLSTFYFWLSEETLFHYELIGTVAVDLICRLLQNFKKNEANEDEDTQDGLLSTRLGMHLSVPRTPGTETGQVSAAGRLSGMRRDESV